MYGLKQAAILAYKQVSGLLKKAGYYPLVDLWECGDITPDQPSLVCVSMILA